MDTLKRLLGLEGSRSAIYRYVDGEVSREDFEYAKVLDQVLFDEKIGYIATIGPTWNLVNDPRFVKLDNTFVVERAGFFGGNANVGQREISETGFVGGNSNDLEKYSNILGDGRAMLEAVQKAGLDPHTFKDSEEFIGTIIRQQYSNWFRMNGTPNKEAIRLYDMCRDDLVGLVYDYSEIPLANEWVNGETGELLDPEQYNDPDILGVNLEVDQLDKAITARAQLRLMAVRILKELGLANKIDKDWILTNSEKDNLLRIIYRSNWPEGKPDLLSQILGFISSCNQKPYEEREKEQLSRASEESREVVTKIKTGEIKQINRDSDGVAAELDKEDTTDLIDSITKDPLKRNLFMAYTTAESICNKVPILDKQGSFIRIKGEEAAREVVELLKPVFSDPNYELTDEKYWELSTKVQEITALPVQTVEEEYHSKESPYR